MSRYDNHVSIIIDPEILPIGHTLAIGMKLNLPDNISDVQVFILHSHLFISHNLTTHIYSGY